MIRARVTAEHRLSEEELAESLESGFRAAGEAFTADRIPRRFAPEGARELGYEARDPAYEAAKVRAVGHRRPLEFTGETRRRAERAEVRVVGHQAAGPRVHVDYQAPAYVTRDPRRRRELNATSEGDAQAAAEAVDTQLAHDLNRPAPAKEVR